MKKSLQLVPVSLAVMTILTLPAVVVAQGSDTTTGVVSVTVEPQVITLTQDQGLSFGSLVPFGSPGTLTVTFSGAVLDNGVAATSTVAASPGSWSVTGTPDGEYAITLPENGTVTVTDGLGNSMAINNFRVGNFTSDTNRTLDSTGADTFTVGAAVSVGANQAPGDYSGTYDVTVAFR